MQPLPWRPFEKVMSASSASVRVPAFSMLRQRLLMFAPLLVLLLLSVPAHGATYLPIAYTIPQGTDECLYERITKQDEDLTASAFVLAGDELRATIVLEGPVAPVDLDLYSQKGGGRELERYLKRYEKEGTKMFVNGKFGDSMLNVKPLRIAEAVDFEEEEEDYYDDYAMTEGEREEFNAHHDKEHQHIVPPPQRGGEERGRRRRAKEEGRERGKDEGEGEPGEDKLDDDVSRAREEMRIERLREMAALDDDFAKLQTKGMPEGGGEVEREPPRGEEPRRRTIVHAPPDEGNKKDPQASPRRRLREEVKLLAGEPYQKTVKIESPGWYRLCVRPISGGSIEAEMELRKSSVYGPVDPRTGHVPSAERLESHVEIQRLYEKEDDARILEEEGGVKDEDLRATREQLRILERAYSDIIGRQLEERRTWRWRTTRNQHLYSHLVLGNLVETVVYMGITGWQVYTIRKWFGGGPALGR